MQALRSSEDLLKNLIQDATDNYLGSVTLMKQLTVAVVSMVVHLKDAFPPDSYYTENFRDLKLQILKKKCANESAQFLSTALINAFDALDKKYLHRLELCFYDDQCIPENLVDRHIFEYTYKETGGGSVRVRPAAAGALHDRVSALLQSCTVFNNSYQSKLPSSFDISLKLYYNEAAPEDYQAPGFRCGEELQENFSQVERFHHFLGEMETPYHGLRVISRFKNYVGSSSHEAIASQNPPLMTQTQDYLATSSPAGALRCPCGLDRPLPPAITSLITCEYCKTQQHAVCYGWLRGASRPHCCAECAERDAARAPSCAKLALANNNRQLYSARRLALASCRARGAAGEAQLTALGLSQRVARHLLDYLHFKDVIAHDDWDVTQEVNERQLQELMSSHFYDLDELGLVDRLLEETRASQDSQHEPVADLLGPNHMASLRPASGGGGALLQQYRQALTPTLEDLVAPLAKRKLQRPTSFRSKLKAKRSRGMFE